MCKEELHWRPFPDENYVLDNKITDTNPRDRPLTNILFETSSLFERLRPWVRRDLFMSRTWIAKAEGRPVEKGGDDDFRINDKKHQMRGGGKPNGHGHGRAGGQKRASAQVVVD